MFAFCFISYLLQILLNQSAPLRPVATTTESAIILSSLSFLSASLRGEVLEEVISTESIDGMIKPVILKKQLSAKDRIKAAELLGKRYALFTEKVDLEGNVGVTIIDDIGTLEDA